MFSKEFAQRYHDSCFLCDVEIRAGLGDYDSVLIVYGSNGRVSTFGPEIWCHETCFADSGGDLNDFSKRSDPGWSHCFACRKELSTQPKVSLFSQAKDIMLCLCIDHVDYYFGKDFFVIR